uniref:Acetyl-CoA carboxylase (Trinotate prediction) n=1 Tax=Myxobolus squamalis TaxID=59785 RepID=A0A6B2G5U6_MYXSQ
MKDMYNQVLKFGAMIVDSLRAYTQPVFIYIMPNGELRGGSWAVLDTCINPHYIELYSSEQSSANILEPSGLVAIKYRTKDIIKTICRLHKDISESDFDIISPDTNDSTSRQEYCKNQELLKSYKVVAENFAQLHDTPNRMLLKGVIREIVTWRDSRKFFYWRLKRRLYQQKVSFDLKTANPLINHESISNIIQSWFEEQNFNQNHLYLNDEKVVKWYQEVILSDKNTFYNDNIKYMSRQTSFNSIKTVLDTNPSILMDTMIYALQNATDSEKQEFMRIISKH